MLGGGRKPPTAGEPAERLCVRVVAANLGGGGWEGRGMDALREASVYGADVCV